MEKRHDPVTGRNLDPLPTRGVLGAAGTTPTTHDQLKDTEDMDTRHLPGTRVTDNMNAKTDDEIITQGLNSEDYLTRRLATLADRYQRDVRRVRRELEALKDCAEHVEPEQAGA